MTSNWFGLPYPPGRHLRCDAYRESLGSLRAYYYNPHITTTSQSYCSFFLFFSFSFMSLIADGPLITIPPVVTKDLPISPRFTPYDFLSRCKFSTLTTRQPMVEFYLLTFPRFPLRKKEHKSYFRKNRTHDFRTSRCADNLLDHSGDEHCVYQRQGGACYESLKRVIGINHKYWNHGNIKGDKSVITPFDIRNGVILTLEG